MTRAIVELTGRNQAIAATPELSVWASANAGAGKTKVLIDRIARLLLRGSDPAKILAVTYTKAAAAEMQTRLYGLLGSWTISPDKELTSALQELDPDLGEIEPSFLANARALFAKALETPGGLKIQTIHGFCQTILQRFPLEAGVPPGFTVLEDAAAKALQAQVFHEAYAKAPAAFLEVARLTSQDDHQRLILDAMSAAGQNLPINPDLTGIADQLAAELQIDPSRTKQSYQQEALDDLDRAALIAAAARLETGGTKDKELANKLIRLAQDSDHEVAWQAWRTIVLKSDGEQREKFLTKKFETEFAVTSLFVSDGALVSNFMSAQEKARAVETYHRSLALTQAVYAFKAAWTKAKQAIGGLDFDDLLVRTAALLRAGEGAAAWVLFKLDAGLAHILIDEAQDTNPQQWDLLEPLFNVLEQEARTQPRTRFIVGDEKQSIYSFQGAKPERFLEEKARFEAGATELADQRRSLEFDLSFRSSQTILNAVDAVWACTTLGGLPPLAPTDAADPPFERKFAFPTQHIAFRTEHSGAVELWPKTVAGEKAAESDAWDHPLNIEREDSSRNRLAERIALELKARLDRGFAIPAKEGLRPMTPGDVMILVKKRGPFFHQLIKRLKYHKVHVAGADRIKLVEDPAIQDLIALGRFALLPQDDFNTACVLKGAFCGLVDDDAHLFPLAWDRGSHSLWQRLQHSADPAHALVAAFLKSVLGRAGHMPPYEFFASILERPCLESTTGWTLLIERLGHEAREPVEAFLGRALSHGRTETPNLHGFLAAIETDAADVKREMEQGSDGVRVMTIHGAKGLEAPVVILPETTSPRGATKTSFHYDQDVQAFLWSPTAKEDPEGFAELRANQTASEKQEDARLLYVAMTRARDLLILCGFHFGQQKKDKGDTGKDDADEKAKDTWYDLFEQALNLMGPGQKLEGQAGPDDAFSYQLWGEYVGNLPADALLRPAPSPLPAWIDQPPPTEKQRARRIAPSALAPDGSEPATLSPLQPDARLRFLRGRLIHELLQRLPDVPEDTWEERAGRRLAREADLSEETCHQMIDETLAVLRDPTFAPLFGPGSRAEATIVGRGPGLPDDMVVNGSVDRLVVTPTEVLVLDFKTNRPPPQTLEGVAQVYLNQMAAYRALLQGNWPTKKVRCALLWTDGPRLMELPDQILDDALRVIAGLPS
ncbi:MAG: double-strand break repair helicase AddA [Hyphomonadaceae bacterium]